MFWKDRRFAAAAATAAVAAAATAVAAYYIYIARKRRSCSSSSSSSSDSSSSSSTSSTEVAVYIHFGTETGTAESVSEQIAAELRALPDGLDVTVADLEDFSPASFLLPWDEDGGAPRGSLALRVLVLATHGEGAATENARNFESWLQSYAGWLLDVHFRVSMGLELDTALDLLQLRAGSVGRQQQLQQQQQQQPVFLCGAFAVLGLCSSSYPSTYNAMASRTYRTLRHCCRMQQQLFRFATSPSSSPSSSDCSSSGGEEERQEELLLQQQLKQLLLQLLPQTQPQVVGALGECDDVGDVQAAAQCWTRDELLPAIRMLQQQPSSSSSSSSSGWWQRTFGKQRRRFSKAANGAAAADGGAAAEPGMEAVRVWLSLHKPPTVVKLTGEAIAAAAREKGAQRPSSVSARFAFSMRTVPLLHATDLLLHEAPPGQEEEAAAAAAAAAASHWPGYACKELAFDLTHAPELLCKTADTFYVLPRNSQEEVEWWYKAIGFEKRGFALGDTIHFKEETVPFPTPCTVEDALSLYCSFDLPSREELAVFATMARDGDQRRQWLKLMTDPEHGSTYAGAIRGQGWCLRGLLAALLPSTNLAAADLGLLLLLLSRHRMPRAYTLSSSHLQPLQRGKLRVAAICLDKHQNKRKEPLAMVQLLRQHGLHFYGNMEALPSGYHQGVCSNYLLNLKPAEGGPRGPGGPKGAPKGPPPLVRCFCKASTFKLPDKDDVPLVLIGAGTGIAPFIAFVRHLAALGGTQRDVCLFYGCRDDQHILYKDLLFSYFNHQMLKQQQQQTREMLLQYYHIKQALQRSPPRPEVLTYLFFALSRADPQRKVYVQHKLAEAAELVWNFILAGGVFYVCGRPAMGEAVQAAILSIAASHLGEPRATQLLDRMHAERRYVEELWD